MKLPIIPPSTDAKSKQVGIRLTADQERLLKQYCVRNSVSTQVAVMSALALLIEGFS